MLLKWLSLKRLQCQLKPTTKNGKRKGKQFYEAERFSNRYPKRNAIMKTLWDINLALDNIKA